MMTFLVKTHQSEFMDVKLEPGKPQNVLRIELLSNDYGNL